MARPERLEGRDGAIWTAYVGGATQEVIAAEHGISRQRVGQVLDEVRETIGDTARMDAALLAQERADALLAAVWPAAMAGDPRAVGAALRVLERLARALGTDAPEPLSVTLDRRLDLEGDSIATALRAAFDALELTPSQMEWAAWSASAALYRSAGQEPPMSAPARPASTPVPVVEEPVDARASMEARLRDLVADEPDVDVEALLAEVGEEEGRGDG
ncbi:hypothetical protein P1P68_12695 [Streptomyces scabiei]|uniref:hypothetical protein n=1 Tax=Streptomyces scabiei TaxID=1930 RepID=UPI00298FCAA3|nr:hypothetical protein [Streptomyces scabiei]MDW8805617.1 hypothetical protein [Streptomyces scabiei]